MDTGMLHLHSILRWIILLLLIICLLLAASKNPGVKKASLWLMISAHLMLLIGIYQWLAGRYGILVHELPSGVSVMKDKFYRFFWVEHPLLMIISIVLITVARSKAKQLKYKSVTWFLFFALLAILAAVPWPFREVVGEGRAWFPGM